MELLRGRTLYDGRRNRGRRTRIDCSVVQLEMIDVCT
jgi:hypothetical protein